MLRKLLPILLTAVAIVGVPTLTSNAAATNRAAPLCEPSAAPPDPDAEAEADHTDGVTTADISATWSDRCEIDPTIYLTHYPQSSFADASAAMPSPAVAATSVAAPSSATNRVAAEDEALAPVPIVPQHPGITEDNTFLDVGASRWIAVDDDRESTFGLDVDTGSFSIAKMFVASGWQPAPDSIRPEEWVNSFGYGDVNSGPDALATTVETAAATGSTPAVMRIGVSTAELATADRPAANITFVIDTSGSMDIRERLGMVKASLALLTRNLREDDTVGIVIYGSDAAPLLAPTPVSDWRTIIDAVDGLRPGGSTNMEAGLLLGYQLARETLDPAAINVVVLASDGVANVGVTDPDVLTDTITTAGDDGIKLVTVGFGMGNYNDVLMEQLANQGDGFYSYIDTYAEAVRLFVDELTPTLTTVAKDAKVQVVFDDEVVARYRLIGYENRKLDDSEFRDDNVDAGELGAGHHATAVYELELVDGADADAAAGEIRLRWEDPDTGEITETATQFAVGTDGASPTLRFASLVGVTAEFFRGDAVIVERGVSIEDLLAEAAALDELGVAGAAEFGEFLNTAQHAQVIEQATEPAGR